MVMSVLSIGNPHAIIKLDALHASPLEDIAPHISSQALFPEGANVGFMQIIDDENVRLRTFERGVGETCACGSNACAAAVAGIYHGWLKHQVNIIYSHGLLSVEWQGENAPVHLIGPAARVYTGTIHVAQG
jgi:diaminopimelate epimerase